VGVRDDGKKNIFPLDCETLTAAMSFRSNGMAGLCHDAPEQGFEADGPIWIREISGWHRSSLSSGVESN
jgi:hypothetical protein